ncbi:MAG: APC family permease [Phycisphaerae bacterium]
MSVQTDEPPPLGAQLRRVLFGRPRDLADRSLFHRLALVPFLAWVGLGADGLSSSAYGPEEAFRTLGEHTYLAVALAVATAATVFIISAGYMRIIHAFPSGGGGYVVATHLLGEWAGLVSGCALLIDYVLTITVSVAAAAAALYSLQPELADTWKLPTEVAIIIILTTLNLRGLRESVGVLVPIFAVFVITHLVVIVGGIVSHVGEMPHVVGEVTSGFQGGLTTIGLGGMALLFMHAYSMGGGTYTGIEAVSNGLQIMREPRVANGMRTMLYMAASLAFTAAGLLVCYLLWHVRPVENQTMNATLVNALTAGIPLGGVFTVITLASEAALLGIAAQAGFVDGPRVLANMGVDGWVPRRFAALSERLTTHNGILFMSAAALAALIYARGDVRFLIVLYSINVFVTFSLSMFGMLRRAMRQPRGETGRRRDLTLFTIAFGLCGTILVITIVEKFHEGGWLTMLVTGAVVGVCIWIRGHYRAVSRRLAELYAQLERVIAHVHASPPPFEPNKPTAAILVAGYGGLGIHTLANVVRAFPGHFKNVVFISVGVVDSGEFKGDGAIERLKERTEQTLARYVDLAQRMGLAAQSRFAIGTDVVEEAEKLCMAVTEQCPQTTFFAGKVIFQREQWYQRLLHNETATAVQQRLHWSGRTMVILPARVV